SITGWPYGLEESPLSVATILETSPQFVAGPMDIGLYRAQRQIQRLGDLLVRIALHMAQHDAGAIFGPQPRDGALDRRAELATFDFGERALSAIAQVPLVRAC